MGAAFHTQIRRSDIESMPRGTQGLADVTRRLPSGWVALDDDDPDWPQSSHATKWHQHSG